MSPFPTSFSAPLLSNITRLSKDDDTWNAILEGIFALIIPVTTSALGVCVAIIRWIPAALAF